ncbi:nuclear transport factor 2 family protein [Dyella halodurans]|uniref:Nuclear transport factor 2 family protein n=2 Tax=Dyella halodurans TaxID=1920171 RepID=A0ABV9C6W6_9GAMM
MASASNSYGQARTADPDVSRLLRQNDELLLNAIHRGDGETWNRLTTSDFMYVEEGDVNRKPEFLRELKEDGLAPLIITEYEVQVIGDTAQVFYRDDVPQRPGGPSTRNAHLLMTETWQHVDGAWLLRMVHTDRIRVDPPAIVLSPQQMDELVGTYRSRAMTYVVRRQAGQILASTGGTHSVVLKAETRDVLFEPGDVWVRKVFQRDVKGRVTGFVDRSESTERAWTRVSASTSLLPLR